MQHPRAAQVGSAALLAFPELEPAGNARPVVFPARPLAVVPAPQPPAQPVPRPHPGTIRSSVLSFQTMHNHGELLVAFLRARKKVFIDRLHWRVPETEGMEFDQYDTPLARWVIIHEFGEVLGGIRLTPTTAQVGIYSYMLRDAQKGLLHDIPQDVLFFEAPVSETIWEASRLFIAEDVPSHRRLQVQSVLMETMSHAALMVGAGHVIGIVPAVWSRWLRRLELDAVPVGPRFAIDGTASQAALFKTNRRHT